MPDTPALTEVLTRQAPLALTLPASVHIVGCGGVGSWIAMFLALARTPRLYLWDNDVISNSNLNRLPLGPDYVGQSKSLALRHMLDRLTTGIDVQPLFRWTPEAALPFLPLPPTAELAADHRPHWIVAATDTWQSRCDIHQFSLDHGLSYLEASSEGEYGGITGQPATFATPDETHPGYASVPVHVGPCVAAASLAVYHILHNINPGSASYRLGWTRPLNPADATLDFQHSLY